jgi:hypothetical protein
VELDFYLTQGRGDAEFFTTRPGVRDLRARRAIERRERESFRFILISSFEQPKINLKTISLAGVFLS